MENLEPELKEELANSSLWNAYFNSLCNYLFIFILKSIEQLNENGELIFICTDYWLNTTHAKPLRNHMVDSGFFENIYHFNEAPLFENVTASFIIFKSIKKEGAKSPITLYEYTKRERPTANDLNSAAAFIKKSIPPFQKNSRWILDDANVQEQISALEKACHRGNDFFQILLPHRRLLRHRKPFASTPSRTFRAIQLRRANFRSGKSLPSRERFFQILLPHRRLLRHRKPFASTPSRTFRAIQLRKIPTSATVCVSQKPAAVRKKMSKNLCPLQGPNHLEKKFRFRLVDSGIYALQDVTGVVPKKNLKESIYHLLAFLNPAEVTLHDSIVSDVKGYLRSGDAAKILSISQAFKILLREPR